MRHSWRLARKAMLMGEESHEHPDCPADGCSHVIRNLSYTGRTPRANLSAVCQGTMRTVLSHCHGLTAHR